jgi:cation diffusion facilitator CzcD-associated flavoprotein CzcO
MNQTGVVIVGAGPYGLALAAHLRPIGIPFRIFGRSMETWNRHMPAGMFLKSEGFACTIADPTAQLTLARFCRETGRSYADVGAPVPIETFRAYGEWFQQEAVPGLEQVAVVRVALGGRGFQVALESGEEVEARRVVLAVGVPVFAHLPSVLRDLPAELATHTSEHASFERFEQRDVAVVGAGQSAVESAVLLHEAGARPTLIARTPELRWNPTPRPSAARSRLAAPMTPLGASWKLAAYSTFQAAYRWAPAETRVRVARTTLGPAAAWWLRSRLTPDLLVLEGSSLARASAVNGGAALTLEGTHQGELHVDHVVAGTGYRVDLDRVACLDPALTARLERVHGAPRLSRHFESSVPGLYFVGLPAANTFGPAMRFVCGAGFASRRVVGRLARG